ncbi:MAG: cation:proton antiporter [Nanohaloarchaea archaeon]|nr:cation:proton antiporter [Candidatus Nanohaloarchaea archaeon]
MTGFETFGMAVAVATVFAFIARKTHQPTIIAYIAAGMVLGPVGLGILAQTELTKILSELGLVFLLFLIGLEIDVKKVREVLRPTVLIGIFQMILTFGLGAITGFLLGFTLIESIFIGAASMFSSTALVVKLLTDKDETSSLPGRLDVGILLIQDVAVVIILALISTQLNSPTQAILRLGEVFVMIGVIGVLSYLSSQYLLPQAFKKLSKDLHSFFIHGIAWAFALIFLAQQLNLSMEIGAFFAGLSLAQLPYSRELQERVRPLTDIFMAVFFINFGLKIVPGQLTAYITEALIASAVLIAGKFVIIFLLTDRMKFTPQTSFKAAVNMTQISEFSLILGALALSEGLIGSELVGFISLVAVITMGISSYLLNYNQEIFEAVEHLLERFKSEDKQDVSIERLEEHAVVVGYDKITEKLLDDLKRHYEDVVIVDRSSRKVDELAESDFEFIYGDFRHSEIRRAAGLKDAEILVSVAPEFEVNREILEHVRPETTVFVKADEVDEAADLYEMGAHYVIIRNILTGEKMSDYVKLFLEDRELFLKEIEDDVNHIKYGGREDV